MNSWLEKRTNELKIAYANEGLKLECTVTEYPKVRKPRGWRLMQPEWPYAECPQCHASKRTYYTGKSETERPYTHYKYLCGTCGREWEQTKIWD